MTTNDSNKDTNEEKLMEVQGQLIRFADELSGLYHKERKDSSELNKKLKDIAIAQKQSLLYAEELSKTYQKEKKRAKALKEALYEIEVTYDATLLALANALDAREKETHAHAKRVMEYTLELAAVAGIEGKELIDIGRGSLLHDIGKIGITDNILLKPGKLTDEEWELMRTHPTTGYNILKSIRFLKESTGIVYTHQEKFDGTGYPQGLKGDAIPRGSRLFAIADTLDAMTTDRPYRKALTYNDAKEEIEKHSGTQFDPWAVEIFLKIPQERWDEIKVTADKNFKSISE